MLCRAIVRSRFDCGCVVCGPASGSNLWQLDGVHGSGLGLALGAFCTSPVSSLCREASGAPLEERQLELSMHYYVRARACINNPAHRALHEFDQTTGDLCAPGLGGGGGMTRPRPLPLVSGWRRPWPLRESVPNWSAPWGYPTFRRERVTVIPRGATSLREWADAWSLYGGPRLGSMSFVRRRDHMMRSALVAPGWTREWGRRRSSAAISGMVRQPAAGCPGDCRTAPPSLQLGLQPSIWHWAVAGVRWYFDPHDILPPGSKYRNDILPPLKIF